MKLLIVKVVVARARRHFYIVWMLTFHFWKQRVVFVKSLGSDSVKILVRSGYLNSPFY